MSSIISVASFLVERPVYKELQWAPGWYRGLTCLCFEMFMRLLTPVLLALGLVNRAAGTGVDSGFVTASQGEFFLDTRTFRHGTNAYWLNMVTDEDLDFTFLNIAGTGYTVVRTWAFNDVSQKPVSGTDFQTLQGGTATINDGPGGLHRLNKVVATANKYGLKLLLTLTNNWNPQHAQSSISTARMRRNNNALPRGFLSNDYVLQFGRLCRRREIPWDSPIRGTLQPTI
ncbi:glycoside hydrolase family 5 protein [Jaapia argillacea MUCL 33604]|uniref:Glycoside hydrolase family 5 protein n=1 Tax=Jaapia argillacea MUCL 33604 TaxID=933084 RepID=A0A067PHM9_9AGAM|nr:glycoside hydrolase family 5 protein [Jaapia argillacea MUCL 33604]